MSDADNKTYVFITSLQLQTVQQQKRWDKFGVEKRFDRLISNLVMRFPFNGKEKVVVVLRVVSTSSLPKRVLYQFDERL